MLSDKPGSPQIEKIYMPTDLWKKFSYFCFRDHTVPTKVLRNYIKGYVDSEQDLRERLDRFEID
ncbi:MAG: hypothetical protein VX294_04140 [Candidatus Latescibacterota bacterium]|nr:hypothetical protein [Candidatus Latescibacterota bacterium]